VSPDRDPIFDAPPVGAPEYADVDRREPSNADFSKLKTLGDALLAAEVEVEEVEAKLAAAKKRRDDLAFGELPALMAEVGMKHYELANGRSVDIEQVITASIPDEHYGAALKWLHDNGHAGIIKCAVVTAFTAGQEKAAEGLAEVLRQKFGNNVKMDQGVHSSTLRAWVKKRIEAEDVFPRDLFGAQQLQKAKVT
jgi:hypothetical protein